eukprot:scaffold109416_cov33-Tisochrysis_lutea.AAC.8
MSAEWGRHTRRRHSPGNFSAKPGRCSNDDRVVPWLANDSQHNALTSKTRPLALSAPQSTDNAFNHKQHTSSRATLSAKLLSRKSSTNASLGLASASASTIFLLNDMRICSSTRDTTSERTNSTTSLPGQATSSRTSSGTPATA